MKKPEFYLDERLRFRPHNLDHLNEYIQFLHEGLKALQEPSEIVRALGELGVHLRSADRFTEAEAALQKALEIITEKSLGPGPEVQQKLRLAHVYQEERKFTESDRLFVECLRLCKQYHLDYYYAFALQHHGKNLFDQKRYEEALKFFEEALELRLQSKAPQEQIDSTRVAIDRTRELLLSHRK